MHFLLIFCDNMLKYLYLYGWYVNNCMQNYFGDLSFDDYSSQYTYSTHRDDEDSEKFEPRRNSMWY